MELLIAAYVVVCILVGFCGTYRRFGFFGTFIAAVLLTPVVTLIILMMTGPASVVRKRTSAR
jgi:hypothetical protein